MRTSRKQGAEMTDKQIRNIADSLQTIFDAATSLSHDAIEANVMDLVSGLSKANLSRVARLFGPEYVCSSKRDQLNALVAIGQDRRFIAGRTDF
jgi:hypothetical protein